MVLIGTLILQDFLRKKEINKKFNIKVIGDVSCDLNGSIPCTKKHQQLMSFLIIALIAIR